MEEKKTLKDLQEQISSEDLRACIDVLEPLEQEMVLLASIGVLSSALPNYLGVYGGHNVYSNLYLIISAPAASGKGKMGLSKLLVDEIDKTLQETSKSSKAAWLSQDKQSRNKYPPNQRSLVIPANISSAAMYRYLGQDSVLIFETEADTLSTMLSNDWSNYSDVLRKAFHHEPVSIARKEDSLLLSCDQPQMSIVLSGTPAQLKPIYKSVENGLFSRFALYNFKGDTSFKNVWAHSDSKIIEAPFKRLGAKMQLLHSKLSTLGEDLIFSFTEAQKEEFLSIFEGYTNYYNLHSEGFSSCVKRHGLIFTRMGMVLSIVKNIDFILSDDFSNAPISCNAKDFELIKKLVDALLLSSYAIYKKEVGKAKLNQLATIEKKILGSLPKQFTSKIFKENCRGLGLSNRTGSDKLNKLGTLGFIEKVKHGEYLLTDKAALFALSAL